MGCFCSYAPYVCNKYIPTPTTSDTLAHSLSFRIIFLKFCKGYIVRNLIHSVHCEFFKAMFKKLRKHLRCITLRCLLLKIGHYDLSCECDYGLRCRPSGDFLRLCTQLNSPGHYRRRCWHLLYLHLYVYLNKNFVISKLLLIGFRFQSSQL